MRTLCQYWNMWCIDPAGDSAGFKCCHIHAAQNFLQTQRLSDDIRSHKLQDNVSALLSLFKSATDDVDSRSKAGLCLRCYVSEPILNACRKLDTLFGGVNFTYRDLLPFVLNDDGKTLIVLDCDRNQLALHSNGDSQSSADCFKQAQTTTYPFFSVQILQTFKPQKSSSMSLDGWAYLQTKQNPDLKNFLSEFGFKQLSDWALLNRARPKHSEQLTERDRHLIEVFHAVYRRDRREQHQGRKRCLEPTPAQLQEMRQHLQARGIATQPRQVMTELRQVAIQLRQYDLWNYREPLELRDLDGDRTIRSDLPRDPACELNLEEQEEQELLAFFHAQLQLALVDSIKQAVCDRFTNLKSRRGYAALADRLLPGLRLYYRENRSLKEISVLLGLSSWAQARRILSPGELISTVRALTIRRVLEKMLKKAEEKGLTRLPPNPDYLKNLAEQIELLADANVFQEAFEEIRVGKNRQMKSVYAQQLCVYLEADVNVTQDISNV